jgi:hypothetical protein
MAMGMGVWMERPRTLLSGYRAKMLMGWGNEGEKRVVGGATRGSVASGRCLHSRPSLETSPSPQPLSFHGRWRVLRSHRANPRGSGTARDARQHTKPAQLRPKQWRRVPRSVPKERAQSGTNGTWRGQPCVIRSGLGNSSPVYGRDVAGLEPAGLDVLPAQPC